MQFISRYPKIDLAGAHVVVTGGAQGIGRAAAQLFAERGTRVSIGDLNVAAAEDTAAGIDGYAARLDVGDAASYAEFFSGAEAHFGPVDVLVNNAGVMPNGGFLDLDAATTRLMIEVNLMGAIYGMQLALPGMLERGRGHIVNVASLAGKFPIKGLAVYNASKFAVVGLTASTRLEYADRGVSLTAVLPSAVDTALASGLDMRPIPKVQPEEVASAIVDSVSSRAGEIAVPKYVGALAAASAVTPAPMMGLIRRAIRDDRALKADSPERAAYRQTLRDRTR